VEAAEDFLGGEAGGGVVGNLIDQGGDSGEDPGFALVFHEPADELFIGGAALGCGSEDGAGGFDARTKASLILRFRTWR
jgi:hypothetical protein